MGVGIPDREVVGVAVPRAALEAGDDAGRVAAGAGQHHDRAGEQFAVPGGTRREPGDQGVPGVPGVGRRQRIVVPAPQPDDGLLRELLRGGDVLRAAVERDELRPVRRRLERLDLRGGGLQGGEVPGREAREADLRRRGGVHRRHRLLVLRHAAPLAGEGRVPQHRARVHRLDLVGRHGRRLIVDLHDLQPLAGVVILALPEKQELELPEEGQDPAHTRLEEERPGHRRRPPVGLARGKAVALPALEIPPLAQPGREAETALVVLVQHHHAPVGLRRDRGLVRDVHAQRDGRVLGDLRDVADPDRVVEAGARLPEDEALEEQAVVELEAGDGEEEEDRHADDAREEDEAGRDDARVRRPPHAAQEQPPVERLRPGGHDEFLRHRRARHHPHRVGQGQHQQQPEGAADEGEDLGGKRDRDRQHPRHDDEEEPEHHHLQVIAALAVGDPAVAEEQDVQPHHRRQDLRVQPEVAEEKRHDGGKRELVQQRRHPGRPVRPRQAARGPGDREQAHGPGVDLEVDDRRDREQDQPAAEQPAELLHRLKIKLRPLFHRRRGRGHRAPRRGRT